MEGAVEANPISMFECLDDFFVVIESLSAESDHDIWEVLLELRFHLHVETDRMHVPPVLSLPVVCHSQKMTLPVLEQFAPVLAPCLNCCLAFLFRLKPALFDADKPLFVL